jgi:hypothetical protein
MYGKGELGTAKQQRAEVQPFRKGVNWFCAAQSKKGRRIIGVFDTNRQRLDAPQWKGKPALARSAGFAAENSSFDKPSKPAGNKKRGRPFETAS